MDETKGSDSVLAFDTLFTTNHIQIMKTLLPYLDETLQKHLAILIKYMELQYTISYFKKHKISFGGRQSEKKEPDLTELYPRIQSFLTEEERSRTQQIMNMLSMMQNLGQMQEMMNMMNAMNDADSDTNSDPTDLLMGMLSPEQRSMFEMFQNT